MGVLQVYKARSMESLLEFWKCPEYQKGKKLREGIVETNFTVAIKETG